jgi:methylmalonyl-CoA mutase N-terminal domain/subunit
MWAKITHDLGATDPQAQMLRFHTQTGGSTLTAQQPQNNIVRVTLQALSAVLGGTQSLHTNGFDEALSLPTEDAAKIALRTQQIIGNESGVTNTVDPLGGSYYVEALTNQIEAKAYEYIQVIEAMGGSVMAIEQGYMQNEIAKSAYLYQQNIESNEKIIVGVNKYTSEEVNKTPVFRIDDSIRQIQIDKINKLKSQRNSEEVEVLLNEIKMAAQSDRNLMPYIIKAVEAYATLGEVSDILRSVFGEYKG